MPSVYAEQGVSNFPTDVAQPIHAAKQVDLNAPIITAVDKCPPTKMFPVPENLDRIVRNPGVPRANIAPSAEMPNGSPEGKRDLTVMQQHVEFFDRKKDGIIWPYETYQGFRAVGFNIFFCVLAMLVIHGAFSYPSLDSWIPHPGFPVYIKNIHRLKHGSDSGTYDTEGRYITQRFEEVFSKYDRDNKGGLNIRDILTMTNEIRNTMDFFGWFANKFEWGTLWLLCADDNGVLRKEDARRCFDGTLFYHYENLNKQKKLDNQNAKQKAKALKASAKVPTAVRVKSS
ncbi:Caleosin related protein-domain-containing protein [Fimicolochytrium jonesii]|uniref:Caleosin related protein-domain-containing protein n=1 Tax=Fimicolochytrium jonesii TaxID=1396493 RepID=UPI0022FF0843|nr:Caleosin related protein-domain-containing protein [Fimicolochytrium jonesii]KAI8825028.1 Caleosin related protein-domain-containing protein [Fimicolochytrium jonesii]